MENARKICVIGLGYVGLPVAVAFGRRQQVIAFDVDTSRIAELKYGYDRTGEVDAAEIQDGKIIFTSEHAQLRNANFYIVAVPTPIDSNRRPDFAALMSATKLAGSQLKPGDIVVYESTVYPGTTEEICLPELERISGLKGGKDFKVGYSPERINPGDKEHSFAGIIKVVSAQDAKTLEIIAKTYESVVEAGVHRAMDIRTAEAAKLIENTQRDLNIALMNELSIIFNHLNIDTLEVLQTAETKWNFLPFRPGLVGGHCIGVDPYYLTFKAEQAGYHSEVLLSGRRINDGMGHFVVSETMKRLLRGGLFTQSCRVTVFGVTFKEDVPDLRNSQALGIIKELEEYGLEVQVHDPVARPDEADKDCGQKLTPLEELQPSHAIVIAVAHRPFREKGWGLIEPLIGEMPAVVIDVQGMLFREKIPAGVDYWRL